jgi:ABC-type sugar transport system ATPase subunit
LLVTHDQAEALSFADLGQHTGGAERFDGPALLMLRPEQLQIRTEPAAGTPGVRAVVSSVEYFGHDCVVTAELPGDPQTPGTSVTCRLLGGERLAAGSTVAISVSGAALAYPPRAPAAAG